jgi:hypothetical protein
MFCPNIGDQLHVLTKQQINFGFFIHVGIMAVTQGAKIIHGKATDYQAQVNKLYPKLLLP